jgi:hypothetical protein
VKLGHNYFEHSRAAMPLIALASITLVSLASGRAPSAAQATEPIPISAFGDGIRHWKNGHNVEKYAAYEPAQVRQIADNLLLYQRASGGWPPNIDPLRVLSERPTGYSWHGPYAARLLERDYPAWQNKWGAL